ncbi:NADP-dependent glyceraldehyde-3-phosphate dehydrogenase [Verrucomicrobia bacterium LW23]|nr:NADP-dependent glyceraldehyde-3-phosphate dehydrogenase [Verrucomicrobia bacterium LW23]
MHTEPVPPLAAFPEAFEVVVPQLFQKEYLVAGELRTATAVKEVLSPMGTLSGGEFRPVVLGHVPKLGRDEAMEVLKAAVAAYKQGHGDWPTATVGERVAAVENFVALMVKEREPVVSMLMWEIGKTRGDSEKEFDRTVGYLRDTIEAVRDLDRDGSRPTIVEGIYGQIRRMPLGVVLCMGPFNYPLNETFATLLPALIMGNTVIFKPPKFGTLLFGYLLSAFQKAFPPGVVNMLYGDGRTVVPPVMESGLIDVLALIGSSNAANTLKKSHPKPNRLRCILGLDAKNAAIILPDADVDNAVTECVLGTLSFNGQRCTAIKMIYVHKSIADDFLSRLAKAVDSLKMGMPWEKGVSITPLPENNKAATLHGYVQDAIDNGAVVYNTSRGNQSFHTFFAPTIVVGVGEKCKLYTVEQFGPIIPVQVFTEVSEPIEYITNGYFGQQVSLFGSDPTEIGGLIDPLVNQVCRVNINSQCQRGPDVFPFNGRKDSAEGTLSVTDALRSFSIRALVAGKLTPGNKVLIKEIIRTRSSSFVNTDYLL